jgi:hypothetical protein
MAFLLLVSRTSSPLGVYAGRRLTPAFRPSGRHRICSSYRNRPLHLPFPTGVCSHELPLCLPRLERSRIRQVSRLRPFGPLSRQLADPSAFPFYSLLWRSLFHSHEHWRIRSSYLSTLKPLATPLPSPQPSRPSSPASIFQTLSISSHPPPPPTPSSDSINNLSSATLAPPLQTPVRRPNFESRVSILSTTTSISKMPLFSPTRPSSHLPYINWQTMYKKRAWLDARWGKEEFAKEQVFEVSHPFESTCSFPPFSRISLF